MRVCALLLTAVLVVPGCSGGSGPTDPSDPREILVIAIARSDRSFPTEDTIEGYLAFFFDRDREILLNAVAVVDRVNTDGSVAFSRELSTLITPGVVPGVGYSEGINVDPGRRFQLEATVTAFDGSTIQVSSAMATVPSDFEIDIPAEVVAGDPLPVTWSVTGAESVNVAVDGGVFSEHVSASQGSFTIPASAFAGRPQGEGVNVEITAYNTFYEPLGAAISTLSDAEAAAQKFRGIDNVDGAVGVFGAAYTLGHEVTVR